MSESSQLKSIKVTNSGNSSPKIGSEMNMRFHKLKPILAVTVFAAMLMGSKAYAESNLRVHIDAADNAITALEDTCDPSTGLPDAGDAACIGIETTTGTFSGDLDGTYLAEVNFAVLASGAAPFTSFETFTGTVSGRGSGSVTVLEIDYIAPTGALTGKWRVVKGSGSGALTGVTGSGKVVGTYDATTGLASGSLTGILHFDQ